MRTCLTGSIATDHLMTFDGKFTDSFLEGELDKISVSFLVDDLVVRRGGVAANISFAMAKLGLSPVLSGAVGEDFADYRSWLDRHGVDTASVHVCEDVHTARFVCTTDSAANQIASFYPGAMSQARHIEIGPIAERLNGLDLVVISPNDPDAMTRHTAECRERGIDFVADPSQQLSSMDPDRVRDLITGAAYFFGNEYEAALVTRKTGWTDEEILEQVGTRVTTLGAKGSRIESGGQEPIEVAAAPIGEIADPTGVGDAFRGGYLAGVSWGASPHTCAQIGSTLAAYVIETTGTQEYDFTAGEFTDRFAQAYGDEAAGELLKVYGA